MKEISALLASGSARAIGAAIAAGEISALEATEWYLDRIERFDQGKDDINCVRTVSRLAREEARRADAALAAGQAAGPLHGVPYSDQR
ncbi:hypothetical protein FD733_17650 [Pantoea sp. Eser]|nr:hypothetical protein [Pantoea sp. Eser]